VPEHPKEVLPEQWLSMRFDIEEVRAELPIREQQHASEGYCVALQSIPSPVGGHRLQYAT
jgi:hypothetical protein